MNSQGLTLADRDIKYVSSPEVVRGYTPDGVDIIVLNQIGPWDTWKWETLRELRALGFKIDYDTT